MGIEKLRSPKVIAAGPSAALLGPALRIEVRFMSLARQAPTRTGAERAVGSTWLEPADIIADRLGVMRAEEDRAGVATFADRPSASAS